VKGYGNKLKHEERERNVRIDEKHSKRNG
jgi:hypothetical protein